MAKIKWCVLSTIIGGAIGCACSMLLAKEPEEEPEEFTRLYGYKSTDKEKYYGMSTDYPDGNGGTIHVTDEQVAELVEEHLHPTDRNDIRKICEGREIAWELLSGCMKEEDLPDKNLHGNWYW